VLLRLDMDALGEDRAKAPDGRTDFPLAWVREHDGGRVFATALGHFPDVWRHPAFVQHLLEGMRYAAGRR
jgi:uncharacterized protein